VAKDEHVNVALPKLYGAPAYARPPVVPVAPLERPFDPDSLPLESQQTEDERELAREIFTRPWSNPASDDEAPAREGTPVMRGRPFRLGSITRRIRGDRVSSNGA
jgi:hypothetical protein